MKFMIIENNIDLVKHYDTVGVDRVFIDLETLGKQERQGHLDTVISNHSIHDVLKVSKVLKKTDLLVRVNPLNPNSENEINQVIKNGANIIMLPMFKSKSEVEKFISIVNKRAKVCLLLETSQALCRIDDILEVDGIDEIHIGLNDLHLSMNLDFMFELVSGGIVEYLSSKINKKGICFGFGGIATLDQGLISGEMVLKEHIRLSSSMVILSRAFKQAAENDFSVFEEEFKKLKYKLKDLKNISQEELGLNKSDFKRKVNEIVKRKNLNV